MNKPALLIIDMLQGFFISKNRLNKNKTKLIENINELVDMFHRKNIPVIWVRQEYESDLSDAPLYNQQNKKSVTIKGTDDCLVLPELHKIEKDIEVIKKRFSAFFKTDLNKILKDLNIDELVVCGVNTMTCVRVTAIDAYQRDFSVVLAKDCVDSYDKKQHKNSLKYLSYSSIYRKYCRPFIKSWGRRFRWCDVL